jgi:RNA polymerase sigma-70 factor (ECF subfamily)
MLAVTAAGAGAIVAPRPASAPLVSRAVAGDREAWRTLHRTYHPIAAAFLRKMGVQDGDLEDACQEVFVQMFRYLPTFRGQAELKTWLYRLCITEAGNMRRRFRLADAVRKLLRRELAARPAVSGPTFSDEQARRRVEAALASLKEGERLVFVLYEMEGLAGEQIAEIAGCPVATVWRRLHYARRTFQAAVTQGGAT